MTKLALRGGDPVRDEMLPYGRQSVDAADIEAVAKVLRSDWLTTGPMVDAFEEAVTDYVGADHGVAVSNGTAALHTAMRIAGIGQGDEVIVPTMTFAATANAALYEGARPVFADVQPGDLLIDLDHAQELITPRTKAIVPVDYAGHPCDYEALQSLADDHDLTLIADACHALGATYKGQPVGSLADATCFSFHPVKHITTGEGGMVTTDREEWAENGRRFRHHGMQRDAGIRDEKGAWAYDIPELGQNYRLTDIHCALGTSQLENLDAWITRRRAIASAYDDALTHTPGVDPLDVSQPEGHAYHLYVVRIQEEAFGTDRRAAFHALRAENIGVNVHYEPVHLHDYYQDRLGTKPGQCPHAESAYETLITLPMFPTMSDKDIDDVIRAMEKVHEAQST